ncbi:hypothetical protein [uncultured Propionivibrio sp.]|uniref:hypothetical protein n=1 Tax=uncultured Propionivibrio sp. TaxID=426737 RepID=UPI0029C084B3|nr:hypothetical protein [uncultured Propionivibrio sp.]
MIRTAFLAILGWLLLGPASTAAEMIVFVNPQSGVEQLTRTQITNIFLGNHREYPNGLMAKPIDLPVAAPEKTLFYRALVNKDLDQMAAYWSRLVFAGNTQPPMQTGTVQEAVQAVANNRNAIGYADRKQVDPARVRIVFAFP